MIDQCNATTDKANSNAAEINDLNTTASDHGARIAVLEVAPAPTLDGLADVTTTGATAGQVLKFTGSGWAPGTALSAGGGSGATSLDELSNVSTAGAVDGHVLKYTAGNTPPVEHSHLNRRAAVHRRTALQRVSGSGPATAEATRTSSTSTSRFSPTSRSPTTRAPGTCPASAASPPRRPRNRLHRQDPTRPRNRITCCATSSSSSTSSRNPGQFPGWPSKVDPTVLLSPVDTLRYIDKHLVEIRDKLPAMVAEAVHQALTDGVVRVDVKVTDNTSESAHA